MHYERSRRSFTFRELSDAIKISAAVLHAIEHGTDPMLSTAIKIAAFFGTTVEQMWTKKIG